MSENNQDNGSTQDNIDASKLTNNDELEKAKSEAEKFKNEYLYLRAEFENYKKNSIKERSDLVKYGSERFIRDLLPILDNFERALSAKVTPENFHSFVKGIEMTSADVKSLLNKHSVLEIPSEGQPFDPNIHEALSAEVTDKMPAGHVLRVFQKPYKLHERVIRPGQVVVAQKLDA